MARAVPVATVGPFRGAAEDGDVADTALPSARKVPEPPPVEGACHLGRPQLPTRFALRMRRRGGSRHPRVVDDYEARGRTRRSGKQRSRKMPSKRWSPDRSSGARRRIWVERAGTPRGLAPPCPGRQPREPSAPRVAKVTREPLNATCCAPGVPTPAAPLVADRVRGGLPCWAARRWLGCARSVIGRAGATPWSHG
jgi:hypothetical protein